MSPASEPTSPIRARMTIKSILVVMMVFAVTAASVTHLIRAAIGKNVDTGFFVLFTCIAPLAVMVIASWSLKLFGRWVR